LLLEEGADEGSKAGAGEAGDVGVGDVHPLSKMKTSTRTYNARFIERTSAIDENYYTKSYRRVSMEMHILA
jgi:hypothetical protein